MPIGPISYSYLTYGLMLICIYKKEKKKIYSPIEDRVDDEGNRNQAMEVGHLSGSETQQI